MAGGPVISLDLATRTGVCVGMGDTLPTLAHHVLPKTGEDVGRFLSVHRLWLIELIQSRAPSLLVFEAPVLASRTNIQTTRKLQGLAGVTEMVAYDFDLECREVSPQVVKRALTGSGRADKKAMVAMARQYGLAPACDDEADAFGLWIHTIRVMRREFAPRWDLLFAVGGR